MHSKIPAIVFLALGLSFIVFSKLAAAGICWLDKTIWNEERRKRFPGHGGIVKPTPGGIRVIGASWIACGIFFWFTSK